MEKIGYRLVKNTLADKQVLFELSRELEEFNLACSSRPKEHFKGNWRKYFTEEIEESLTKRESWVMLAESGGVAAGYVYARVCRDCYFFVIEELLVGKEYRGLGVGRELVRRMASLGKKLEMPIRVEVFDWNQKAVEFYKKLGFGLDSLVLQLRK